MQKINTNLLSKFHKYKSESIDIHARIIEGNNPVEKLLRISEGTFYFEKGLKNTFKLIK